MKITRILFDISLPLPSALLRAYLCAPLRYKYIIPMLFLQQPKKTEHITPRLYKIKNTNLHSKLFRQTAYLWFIHVSINHARNLFNK